MKDDASGTLRVRLTLLDRSVRRYTWVDFFEFAVGDVVGTQDWLSNVVSKSVRSALLDFEIDRVADKDPMQLTAWDLSMRASPMVLAADSAAQGIAVE